VWSEYCWLAEKVRPPVIKSSSSGKSTRMGDRSISLRRRRGARRRLIAADCVAGN
jgi:hypothetical protein